MRILIAVSVVVLACHSSNGEEQLVRNISLNELQKSGQSSVGQVERGEGGEPEEYLVITNEENQPRTVSLLTLTDPGITATEYALTGRVSYEGVRETGYLEMWNHFPNGGAYFTKTLEDSGPMGSLRGTSNWRPFSLPFMSNAEAGFPNELEFNLVLPGPGTVRIAELRLVQYPEGLAAASQSQPWWNERAGGRIGAIGGTICGCLGALIGVLCSLGKARRLVLSLCLGIVVLGVICLAAGGIALAISQPYIVYYPLLLLGVILTTVIGGLLPVIQQRYRQIEIRRMTAMDVDTLSV